MVEKSDKTVYFVFCTLSSIFYQEISFPSVFQVIICSMPPPSPLDQTPAYNNMSSNRYKKVEYTLNYHSYDPEDLTKLANKNYDKTI